ncbi:hypothetical protein [Ferribacterium limneticum]|nr:hypothetical protein [Ferribacterium limneticum]UCV30536.1 hypothetical protein KI617_03115 [Ferribacterium limneticum]UCV34453.1 hypothetical protein KI608_03115 [Ferribacterium limneticum]
MGGEGLAAFAARFAEQVTACVVGVDGAAGRIGFLAQPADAVRAAGIPDQGLGLAATGGYLRQPVQGIVAITHCHAPRILAGQQVAGGIEAGVHVAAISRAFFQGVAQAVDVEAGHRAVRGGQAGELVEAVVCDERGFGAAVLGVGAFDRAAQRVDVVAGGVALGGDAVAGFAVGGVAEGVRRTVAFDFVFQATEGVEDAADLPGR